MDAFTLRVDSYKLALDQAQRYLTVALASGVALFLLRAPSPNAGPLTVAPFGVPVDPATASSLFFAVHVVSAALAGYALDSAKRLAGPLARNAELSATLRDYPSVASSPWPAVRLAAPVLCLVFVALTLWPQVSAPGALASGTPMKIIFAISVHVPLLLYLWMPPIGPWTAYKPKELAG